MSYIQDLIKIGVIVKEQYKGAKAHHNLECLVCGFEWNATLVSIKQTHRIYGANGCTQCAESRKEERLKQTRQSNISKIEENFLILSEYHGEQTTTSKITVQNKKCNHIFEVAPGNLIHRDVKCPTCAIEMRTLILNESSLERSEEYRKTATEWNSYRHEVYSLTRQVYNTNKSTINPDNLPRGKAGVEGAYHLDHIVSVRKCFEKGVPASICADPSNLQMLKWKANIKKRTKIDTIPVILQEYFLQ